MWPEFLQYFQQKFLTEKMEEIAINCEQESDMSCASTNKMEMEFGRSSSNLFPKFPLDHVSSSPVISISPLPRMKATREKFEDLQIQYAKMDIHSETFTHRNSQSKLNENRSEISILKDMLNNLTLSSTRHEELDILKTKVDQLLLVTQNQILPAIQAYEKLHAHYALEKKRLIIELRRIDQRDEEQYLELVSKIKEIVNNWGGINNIE